MSIIVRRRSNITGKIGELVLPISEEELREGEERRRKGALIQKAFPRLNAEQREFLLTGITPEEWNEHINPIECQTCKRRMDDDYTVGCTECFDHEHAEE